jgi:hypothetical protein
VDPPPIKMSPLGVKAIVSTRPLESGLKLRSKLPSILIRAILLRATPPTSEKLPPIRIFPSACTATTSTAAFTLGL